MYEVMISRDSLFQFDWLAWLSIWSRRKDMTRPNFVTEVRYLIIRCTNPGYKSNKLASASTFTEKTIGYLDAFQYARRPFSMISRERWIHARNVHVLRDALRLYAVPYIRTHLVSCEIFTKQVATAFGKSLCRDENERGKRAHAFDRHGGARGERKRK